MPASLVLAQESAPVNESSAYLLDFNIGDEEVDLRWDGYWRMSFVAGGSFGVRSDDNVFKGLSQGVSFFQEPDVTISLWLKNRWFLEASFLEGFERNTYRAGYQGAPGDFVREVAVGNAGINATSYAGIEVPSPRYNSPGLVAKFATETSDHQLLLRYDPTDTDSITFRGQYRVRTEEIVLSDFVEGQYFILPDTGVSNVRVYLEDPNGGLNGNDYNSVSADYTGDLRTYRRAEDGEFFVDETAGLLELSEAHKRRVVVYYDKEGNPVGDPVNGYQFIVPAGPNLRPDFGSSGWNENPMNLLDFDWSETDVYNPSGALTYEETSSVSISGEPNPALILYEPGRFTPFERQNIYELNIALPEENWRTSTLLQDRGGLYPETPSPNFGFTPDSSNRLLRAYGALGNDERYPSNRYPFAAGDPDVYGPGRTRESEKISRAIVVAVRESGTGFDLGGAVIPGSVKVYVNGVQDKTVEVVDNRLDFKRYIYIDDWIEVSFRSESLDLDGGDLYIYQGNRFELTPQLTWEIAETLRWNLSDDRTVEEYEQSPGEIKVSTTLDWESDRAGITLTAAGALTTADTAGNYRLFGMENGGTSLGFYTSTLVTSPTTIPGVEFDTGTRFAADQYTYLTSDVLGNQYLNDYLWPGATSTGKDAAGLAARRSGDPAQGNVADIRFTISAGAENWTAADVLADMGGPINLSGYTAIEFPILFQDVSGTQPLVYLQIGEIGEEVDHHSDGVINSSDTGSMVQWNLSSDPEDSSALGNAWSDAGSGTAAGTWYTIRIPINSGDRSKLESVRALRWIIRENAGASSGRLIVGPPSFAGSPFRTEVRTSTDDLAAAQDVSGDEFTDNSLKSEYPETGSLFHPNGENNETLRIRWGTDAGGGATAANDRWEAVSWLSGVPLDAYGSVVFFVKPGQISTGPVTAALRDENGLGITATWNVHNDNSVWDRISVDIANATAVSDQGSTVTVTVDKNAGELTRMTLVGADSANDASSSINSGTLYFDEVYFKDPSYSLSGGGEAAAYWNYDEDVAAIGNFPILGDIALEGRVEAAGGTVLSGVDSPAAAVNGDIGVEADLLGVGLRTDWRLSWAPDRSDWSGSHRLRIPARWAMFWFGDTYSRGTNNGENTFSRENDLNLQLAPGSLRIFGRAEHDGTSLVQAWGGETQWSGAHWSTDLDVEYALTTSNVSSDGGDYFSSWISDYAYLLPATGSLETREARHRFTGEVNWDVIAAVWNPELQFKASKTPDWSQENRWVGTLSLPFRFENWTLTPSYSRSFVQSVDTSGSGDAGNDGFDDGWRTFVSGIGVQFPLFTYIPFAELFGSYDGATFERVSAGYSAVDYSPEFSITLNRNAAGNIVDLFVPGTADVSFRRDYVRYGDSAGWTNVWSTSMGFRAFNLFGAFGRYPVFPFYNRDEFGAAVQLNLEELNGVDVPEMKDLQWQFDLVFAGNREKKFVLDHRLAWDWTADVRSTRQEARIEFHWRTPSKDVLRLPLIKRAIPRQHHVENIERVSLESVYPWANAPSDSVFDLGVIVRHESSWVFNDLGHLKAWLAFGLGGYDDEFTNAWELGLELEIRF